MPRDGMFSGLKMHVDLDRLLQSIDIHTDDNGITRLAGSVAGISPLTQIMFNKMLLNTGMYHHHKVRAVDAMLWAVFELASERKRMLGGVVIEDPIDFLDVSDDRLLIPELTDDDEIKELLQSVRERRLWKRALVISRRTVPETMHQRAGDTAEGRFPEYVMLRGSSEDKVSRRRQLAKIIWEEAGKPCRLHEVWLDVPSPPSMDEGRLMWIRVPGRDTPMTLGDFMPISQWVELFGMHQWQSHVFCPDDRRTRESIGKAAERVLKKEFGLEVSDTARVYAHG